MSFVVDDEVGAVPFACRCRLASARASICIGESQLAKSCLVSASFVFLAVPT